MDGDTDSSDSDSDSDADPVQTMQEDMVDNMDDWSAYDIEMMQ